MDRLDPAQTVTLLVSFFQIIRRLTSFDPLEDWFPASVGVFLDCHVSSLSNRSGVALNFMLLLWTFTFVVKRVPGRDFLPLRFAVSSSFVSVR